MVDLLWPFVCWFLYGQFKQGFCVGNLNGREITLNPCSLVCFIRLEILGILDILGLPLVSVSSRFCLLCHPLMFLTV